jgi:hypothetical protein
VHAGERHINSTTGHWDWASKLLWWEIHEGKNQEGKNQEG